MSERSRERAVDARQLLREASLELARLRRIRGASHRTWRRIAQARARLAFAAALLAAVPAAEPALGGTPNFRALTPGVVGTSYWPASARVAPDFVDIDADGDLDAFVGENSGRTIFFENTGSATAQAFGAAVPDPFGLTAVAGYASPTLADLDGDGDFDALVGDVSGNMSFFENTGTAGAPAFAGPAVNPFGLAVVAYAAAPAFADIDGDGDLDVFVGDDDGNKVFFRNTGSASTPAFAPAATNPFGLNGVGTLATPTFADIDADGDLDALIGQEIGTFLYFRNSGSASVPAFAPYAVDPFGLVHPYQRLSSPAFADIDADGDLDLFSGEYLGSTLFYENTGAPSAPAFALVPANPFGFGGGGQGADLSPAFADIDADGDLDVFAGNEDGGTLFWANTGSASAPAFSSASVNPFGLLDVGYNAAPSFVDIDEDGDLDAFHGNRAGQTILFDNIGTPAAPALGPGWTLTPFGITNGPTYASPTFGDLDGDGDFDALVGDVGGNSRWFENTGTAGAPAFAAPSANPFGLADVGDDASPEFADLDGDGDLDVLVGTYEGISVFFENTGSQGAPAYAPAAANPFGLKDVGALAAPTFADVDADGDLDAFTGNSWGRIRFLENIELGPGTCADGLDNDGDGAFDVGADPGCADANDPSEKSSLRCDNGIDDDLDGKIDWRGDGSGDPQCANLLDDSEAPPPPAGCGIGPELLLLAPALAAARRRRRKRYAPACGTW
jgi:hypothetical protein